jgi:hypothetical protein
MVSRVAGRADADAPVEGPEVPELDVEPAVGVTLEAVVGVLLVVDGDVELAVAKLLAVDGVGDEGGGVGAT